MPTLLTGSSAIFMASAVFISLCYAWRRQRPRRPFVIAAAVGLLVVTLVAAALSLIQATHPTVPGLALANLDGELQNLHDLNDRPMVINMWATWCPPCRREMPVLADAQQLNPDIRFVFINQGDSDTTISSYLKEDQLELQNVLLDPMSHSSRMLNTRAMPTTYFFDADGKLVDTLLGEISAATLNQSLKKLATER